MSFLSVKNLTKSWEEATAVNNLSFDIQQGEFLALLGPSGCGKSTTLKMIAGLEQPTSGQILINDKDVTQLPPGKRNLSMVFQSYALFPHLSVKENVLFGLKARSVPTQEQKVRLTEAVELVGLEDQINKKPGQLSGGQCQRVALARTIVSKAALCLMDEPLSNLDAKLRADMRSEIRSLQKKLGLTVIYVTHDQVEAMSMADRILLLNKGHIEQLGEPESFYEQPETRFVASFIGLPPMNLFQAKHQEYETGVRPEHISIQDQEGIPAIVQSCEYHGAETLVSVQSQGFLIKLSLRGKHKMPTGQELKIAWSAQHEHHFCPDTGQRLTNSAITQVKPTLSVIQSNEENSHAI